MKDILNKIWEFILKVWRSKPVTFITIFVLMCAGIGGFVGAIVELLKPGYVTLGICHVICWAFAICHMVKVFVSQVQLLMGSRENLT